MNHKDIRPLEPLGPLSDRVLLDLLNERTEILKQLKRQDEEISAIRDRLRGLESFADMTLGDLEK